MPSLGAASFRAVLLAQALSAPTHVAPSFRENPAPPTELPGPQFVSFLSEFEFWLSILIVAFGAFVILIEYRLLSKNHCTAGEILRMLAVTLILVGSLFLITAGFSSTQISPISGLFGTVAGYLLGRTTGEKEPTKTDGGAGS